MNANDDKISDDGYCRPWSCFLERLYGTGGRELPPYTTMMIVIDESAPTPRQDRMGTVELMHL